MKLTANDVPSNQPTRRKLHFHETGAGQFIDRLIKRSSSVGDRPLFDTEDFPWAREIETEWRSIRAELDDVMHERDRIPSAHVISPKNYAITQDDNWKNFYFFNYGYRAAVNCERCPETARLIKKTPGMLMAHFSIIGPGKHIPPHRGRYSGVLRCQLGLIVPRPMDACWIRVAEDVAHWREGKTIIFDDTYEHEVQNNTDGWRVVLTIEFLRPLLFPVSSFNKAMTFVIAKRKRTKEVNDYLEKHK